jgi:hypothetical protein
MELLAGGSLSIYHSPSLSCSTMDSLWNYTSTDYSTIAKVRKEFGQLVNGELLPLLSEIVRIPCLLNTPFRMICISSAR